MKRSASNFRMQLIVISILCFTLIWAAAGYELYRSHQEHLREAEVRTSVQAHVFAEYSRSTIKRINEFILDVRNRWSGDWQAFSKLVRQTQENIDDIAFQAAVIDKEGILAFSNLAKPTDRTDLSEREHFKVHKQAPQSDRLFISKPLMGKVSGKWSIQLTRPIYSGQKFNGVLVVSISPEQFASFARTLQVADNSVTTVVRNTGEIMARYPVVDSSLGLVLNDRPFLVANAPVSGNFRQIAAIDGIDRIFGFYTLPEYGMSFVMGEAISEVLAPYNTHRNEILTAATLMSILVSALFFLLFRTFAARETIAQQLSILFDLSPDGFVSFNRRRRVMYASPAFLRMTRMQGVQITGMGEDEFSERLAGACLKQARFPGVAALRAAARQVAALSASPATTPQEAGTGSAQRHLMELTGVDKRVLECDIRLSTTAPVSQVLYFRDVTRETEVDRLKSEFLSTAAHELRTPMTSILGFSEMLLTRDFSEADQRDFAETIVRQSRLVVSIVNELLDLVRIDARRGMDFVIERLDLHELVTAAVTEFSNLQGRTPPEIVSSAEPTWVCADRIKLSQAIRNIISNAYKYSPPGSAVQIELIQTPDDKVPMRACIRITDHGIGMTEQQLARVGERFYRADTSGKIPGTGLGMSIVKEIISLHGGSVKLASEAGKGTTVTIFLAPDLNRCATVRPHNKLGISTEKL